MHPIFGTGIGMKVVLALARPSRPAIATVFQMYAFVVPLASRTAKRRDLGCGALGLGLALGLAAGTAEAVGVGASATGEVLGPACAWPHATSINNVATTRRRMQH